MGDEKIYAEKIPCCPSCGVILVKFPIRKTKCKSCGESFYLMKEPSSEFHYIVDENTRSIWSKETKMFGYIENLSRYGLTDSNFIDDVINKSASLNDAVWSLFNKALMINASDFSQQAQIYFLMALFTVDEGKDPIRLIELSNEARLIDIEVNSHNIHLDVVIITHGNSSCNNCANLNGKVLTVKEARDLKLIPHNPCNYDYCTAMYCGKPKRDKDGFVVTKNTPIAKTSVLSKLLNLFK